MAKYDWIKKIDLSGFSPRERALMIVTAIAVAVFLMLFFYLPAHRQASALVVEREKLDREVQELERQLREAERAARQIKIVRPVPAGPLSIQGQLEGIPGGPQKISRVLEELNRLARATAVDLISLRPEPMQDAGSLRAQPILLEARSTYRGMGRYVQMLENLPRVVAVQGMKIEVDAVEPSYVLARLHLMIYLEKD